MFLLSRSEEIVLLSVWKLQGNAYGISIREEVSAATGKRWSLGAVYAPLHRLEKKRLVKTRKGAPIAERGGRSKVFYQLTSEGKQALIRMKQVNESVWRDAPALVE